MIGKTLSHYKVLEKIGQGGMGEVYRAEDTNLSREVAIKVLPEQFTKDPQRLARFEREAKLLAQLNHPNIAAIYGLEEADGVRFLALELVPGETLQERVAKGPLPVEEALEVCRQIAEGVEAAHAKGVIHRDLKPANVKVTPEGKVKILDFGLAKAFEEETPVADISQSPTLTEEMTRAGVILGTAAYMSPEQAKGEAVDKRADIFAFGCVLYELLTGKRTFYGKTITETLGAIIHKEPEWDGLPVTTPWRIRELLRRCLTKDAHDRLRDIANVRVEIKMALTEPATASPVGVISAVQPTRRLWAMAVGLVALTAIATTLAIWMLGPSSPPTEQLTNRFAITPSPTAALQNTLRNELAISPDGRQIVYAATGRTANQLYLRSLETVVVTPISGTEGGVHPFFSPDGQSLAFFVVGKLMKIRLAGGSATSLCDVPGLSGTGTWGPEDKIIFSTRTRDGGDTLYEVSDAGGACTALITSDAPFAYSTPQILPGGEALLFSIWDRGNTNQIAVLKLDTGEQKVLLEGSGQAKYLPTGHLVYREIPAGNLMAVPFDLTTLETTGAPVPVLEGFRQTFPGWGDYAIADNGTLIYVTSTSTGSLDRTLVWVDREGQEEPLAAEPRSYDGPRISPDGSRIAISVNESGSSDVWIYDLEREILTRFTFDPAVDHYPVWTPDGQRIVFDSGRVGAGHNLFWKAADGTGQAERLTTGSNNQTANSFSPDGKRLVFAELVAPRDLQVLSMEGERTSQPLFQSQFTEGRGTISLDGHWIAYESDESGRQEIYVRPFPNVEEGKWQISSNGGTQPVWAPRGQELFYRNGEAMMVVGINPEPTFTAGSPVVLFTGRYFMGGAVVQYDISPDGQRFLMIKEADEDEGHGQIHVVLNWFEELKRLVPTDN